MIPVNIYALINPTDNQVFYIGATMYPVKFRLTNHINNCKGGYITSKKEIELMRLYNLGIRPEVLHIDTVDIQEASFFEDFYMDLFKSYGFNILQGKPSKITKAWNTRMRNKELKKKLRIDFDPDDEQLVPKPKPEQDSK